MLRLKFAQVRDAVLLCSGLALLGYETLGASEPRIALVTIAAVMMGLPATFVADRWFVGRAPQQPGQDQAPPASSDEPTA